MSCLGLRPQRSISPVTLTVPDMKTASCHHAVMMCQEHHCGTTFYKPDVPPVTQSTTSKHWQQQCTCKCQTIIRVQPLWRWRKTVQNFTTEFIQWTSKPEKKRLSSKIPTVHDEPERLSAGPGFSPQVGQINYGWIISVYALPYLTLPYLTCGEDGCVSRHPTLRPQHRPNVQPRQTTGCVCFETTFSDREEGLTASTDSVTVCAANSLATYMALPNAWFPSSRNVRNIRNVRNVGNVRTYRT